MKKEKKVIQQQRNNPHQPKQPRTADRNMDDLDRLEASHNQRYANLAFYVAYN